jgi:precorrin-8X/cobalt-precorrin-8 methylmutase
MITIKNPHEIEQGSFDTIRSEIGEHSFTDDQLTVAVRVIHATADFDFRDILKFHPLAIESGIAALRRGAAILTDVHMVEAGISQAHLDKVGVQKVCDIRHPAVRKEAKAAGETRSTIAMRRNADLLDGGIAAIGNAPTALFEIIRLVQEEGIQPELIVGVPVGFINTVESKEALMDLNIPYITSVGRKGGSSVAVAALNALVRLALNN